MASTKTFTIFAGVNGAGKSTLFAADSAADLGVRLNTDEIVKSKGWDWKDPRAQIEAGKELLKRQKDCLEKGISFNQETTLSGVSIVKCIYSNFFNGRNSLSCLPFLILIQPHLFALYEVHKSRNGFVAALRMFHSLF